MSLTAVSGNNQIALSWTMGVGATSYNIYRGTSANGEGPTPYATGVGTPFWTDTNVTVGTNYYYKVAAVNSAGTSGMTNESSAAATTIAGSTLPITPFGVSANAIHAVNGEVLVSWTGSSGATSYNLYVGSNSGGESLFASNITNTSYLATGLVNSTTYYFKVAAVNSAGTTGLSNEASAQPAGASNSEGPFGGTSAAIPGTVQAENYDTGGQGVAYNVTSTNGTANSYRTDGIDIESTSDTGGGYDLGWTSSGQWFKYTVNVASAGMYTVTCRVANGTTGNANFHIQDASGANLTGAVTVAPTGGWQTWANVTANVTLPAGQQILTVWQDTGGFNLNYLSFASSVSVPPAPTGLSASAGNSQVSLSWTASSGATSYNVYRGTSAGGEGTTSIATGITGTSYANIGLTNGTTYYYKVAAVNSAGTSGMSNEASATPAGPTTEAPYGGTPWAIPGTIQSENYDTGGEGVAYHDSDATNQGGQYRTTEGVDVETTSDTGGGYDVGWNMVGEWQKYTVNVASAGTYTVTFRVSNGTTANGSFHLQNASGTNLTGTVTVAPTGGWQTWANITANVTLPAGQQILTLWDDGSNYNLNYMSFAAASGGQPDLVVTSVSWTPSPIASGNHVVFSCVVKNQGSAATPPGTIVGVQFAVDGATSPITWSDTDTNSLAPGASVTLTANNGTNSVNYWTATSGSHTVQAWVDDVNRIAESNENNNKLTASFSVP
jgi:fibronectin type 3 domain-containing protein